MCLSLNWNWVWAHFDGLSLNKPDKVIVAAHTPNVNVLFFWITLLLLDVNVRLHHCQHVFAHGHLATRHLVQLSLKLVWCLTLLLSRWYWAERLSHSQPVVSSSLSSAPHQPELQRRFFEDIGGGPLILDPWFCSYFRGKRQANLHGVEELISLGWAAWYWIQA